MRHWRGKDFEFDSLHKSVIHSPSQDMITGLPSIIDRKNLGRVTNADFLTKYNELFTIILNTT